MDRKSRQIIASVPGTFRSVHPSYPNTTGMVVAKTGVMMGKSFSRTALRGCTVAAVVFAGSVAALADETPITKEQFLQLKHQNEQMLQQLLEQQKLIDALGKKVSDLEAVRARRVDTN